MSVGAVSSSVDVGSVFMYLKKWDVKSCDWVQVYTVHLNFVVVVFIFQICTPKP